MSMLIVTDGCTWTFGSSNLSQQMYYLCTYHPGTTSTLLVMGRNVKIDAGRDWLASSIFGVAMIQGWKSDQKKGSEKGTEGG